MPEMSVQEILTKVREKKETLEKKSLELEAARQAVEQLGADLLRAREDLEAKNRALAEKDEAIEELLGQNQELQESLAKCQSECETLHSRTTDQEHLVEELATLLT